MSGKPLRYGALHALTLFHSIHPMAPATLGALSHAILGDNKTHWLAWYLNAVTGKKVRDRMFKLQERVKQKPQDAELFNSIFDTSEIYHQFPTGSSTGRKTDIDLLAYNSGGLCSHPTPAVAGKTCAQTCFSSSAIKLKTPFVAGGAFVSHDVDSDTPTEYCWSGKSLGLETKDEVSDISHSGEKLLRPCSVHTAIMVLTDDGGWQCRPKFPTYFGGPDGTQMASCRFNSSSHRGPAAVYNASRKYVDATSQETMLSHVSFSKSVYLRILRSAKTIAKFKELASDPDLLFKYPVTYQCNDKRDVLNNHLMDESISKKMKFRGLHECLENPCVMEPYISPDFVSFNPSNGTCNVGSTVPSETVHAILGDNRTPLAGLVPAMGLILADPEKRGDKVHTQRTEVAYDEPTAKEITRAAAPVVTASNIDSSNPSRHVLFVPVPSLVLPPTANLPFASMRPSSLLHRSCLPPMLNKVQNQSRPFCTAPFYVEPAANVLAGHVPQKPYEHNLLVTECLRNSRMVSGSIHGGSEILYSTLLSQDSAHNGGGTPVTQSGVRTPGDDRLEEIRDFFDRNFGGKRRLSNVEYLIRKRNLTPERIFDGVSQWDSDFRRGDYGKIGVRDAKESFVLKEGLLIRSYGPYAATVLAPTSFSLDCLKGHHTAKSASALKPFNPLQFAFPTSYSVLPEENSDSDIFSVDSKRIFDSNTVSRYFDATVNAVGVAKLFSDDTTSPMSHYRVDTDDNAWGLQTFRLDYNPKNGPAVISDPRLEFDSASIDVTPRGATLTPLSLFKKTPLEWGHREADIQKSNWFKKGIDTSAAYRRLFVETSMAVRNIWFSLTWENDYYYFVKNSE